MSLIKHLGYLRSQIKRKSFTSFNLVEYLRTLFKRVSLEAIILIMWYFRLNLNFLLFSQDLPSFIRSFNYSKKLSILLHQIIMMFTIMERLCFRGLINVMVKFFGNSFISDIVTVVTIRFLFEHYFIVFFNERSLINVKLE